MLGQSAFRARRKNSHKADFWKRAPSFLQWLRGRPCRLEDRGGCWGKIEACHVDYAGSHESVDPADGKGTASKVHDRYCIPMCSGHHKEQTDWSWPRFEANYRIDGLEDSKAYWAAWPGRRAWEESRGQ